MNLKQMILGTGVAAAIAAVPASACAQFDSNAGATLMAVMLAKEMGIDTHVVVDLSLSNGWYNTGYYTGATSVYDLAPVFVIWENVPRRPRPIEILGYRRRGWGWDRIWTYYKLPMARYRVLYGQNRFDPNYWGRVVTVHQFYVPDTTIVTLRSGGMNWRDITYASFTARQSGQPILSVAAVWRQNRDWNRVAVHYRIPAATMRTRIADINRSHALPSAWRKQPANWHMTPGSGSRPILGRPRPPVNGNRPPVHGKPPVHNRPPVVHPMPGRPIRPSKPPHSTVHKTTHPLPRGHETTTVRTHGHTQTTVHRRTINTGHGRTVTHTTKSVKHDDKKKNHGNGG